MSGPGLHQRLVGWLWPGEVRGRARVQRCVAAAGRLVYGVARGFVDGDLALRASSLAYTTLLSLVPLLAVSFSVLKAFGVHNQLQPLLLELMAPLGERGEQLVGHLLEFVGNLRVGVLGSVGIALLFYTVVSLVHKVELAFNGIWGVQGSRRLARRFGDYLSVILIGPVLIFSGLGLMASLMNTELVQWALSSRSFGPALVELARGLPYLLLMGAFAFLYGFLPYTRVRPLAALGGGVFAGGLWYLTGWVFATFVATSGNYSAIYSGFAIVVLFMLWVYVGWLIVLVGCTLAYYLQHPGRFDPRGRLQAEAGLLPVEWTGLAVMALVARAQRERAPAWQLPGLAMRLGQTVATVHGLVGTLRAAGLLVTDADGGLHLTGDSECVAVSEVVAVLRAASGVGVADAGLEAVTALRGRMDRAIDERLAGLTVKDLALDALPAAVS